MKHMLKVIILLAGFSLFSNHALAKPTVDQMSNIEVSEYAARMSSAMKNIQLIQLCQTCDADCQRAAFTRYGLSYDDLEAVKKRLLLLIARLY